MKGDASPGPTPAGERRTSRTTTNVPARVWDKVLAHKACSGVGAPAAIAALAIPFLQAPGDKNIVNGGSCNAQGSGNVINCTTAPTTQSPSGTTQTSSVPVVTVESPAPGSRVLRPTPVRLALSSPLAGGDPVWIATRTDDVHQHPQPHPCEDNGLIPQCDDIFVGSAAGRGIGLEVRAFIIDDATDLIAYVSRSTERESSSPGLVGRPKGVVSHACVDVVT